MARKARKKQTKQRKIKKAKAENAVKDEKSERLKKEEKQVIVVIIFMVLAFAAFLLFYFIFKNAGAFVYEGIRFQKTESKGLVLYHGKIGMKIGGNTFNYNLYFRNDPRKLASIPANISSILRRTGYISFEPKISDCYGSNIAAYNLASLLGALGMDVKGATTSHTVAIDESIPERDCADALNKTIIVLQHSNETYIQQKGECYTINIANCNVIGASEAFMLAIIKDMWNIVAN